ncbi:ROK family transcriptional regulator [Bounagaea algeriensis]
MAAAKPSLQLLRSLTDEHVLRTLMAEGALTRTDIAARTGISKPTISESVRRLSEAGLVVDTGQRTTGRGRAGSYYTLAADCGAALVATIRPCGVLTEVVDAFGRVVAEAAEELPSALSPTAAAEALAAAVATCARASRLRCAAVSVADPVDRDTGRVVRLPDAPFLVGELDPPAVLQGVVDGPVQVDNDVNWAARAEREAGCAAGIDDFAYVHLGEGLGCAVVTDGEVRRGQHGLAGEIAHLSTAGPNARAMPLTEVFASLDLRRAGSTAIDDNAVRTAITAGDAAGTRIREVLARAVSGALSAVVALVDPRLAVIGGTWGTEPAMLQAIEECFDAAPRTVPIRPAQLDAPEVAGARAQAVAELRDRIVAAPRSA